MPNIDKKRKKMKFGCKRRKESEWQWKFGWLYLLILPKILQAALALKFLKAFVANSKQHSAKTISIVPKLLHKWWNNLYHKSWWNRMTPYSPWVIQWCFFCSNWLVKFTWGRTEEDVTKDCYFIHLNINYIKDEQFSIILKSLL